MCLMLTNAPWVAHGVVRIWTFKRQACHDQEFLFYINEPATVLCRILRGPDGGALIAFSLSRAVQVPGSSHASELRPRTDRKPLIATSVRTFSFIISNML